MTWSFPTNAASQKSSDVAPFVAGIKSIKKIDDHTVEVITDGPRPILLNEIGLWYIVDKEWAEANNAVMVGALAKGEENFATVNANGTGPFMLKLREPDVQTVLVRNPDYWGDDQEQRHRGDVHPHQVRGHAGRGVAVRRDST